jgi:integral membrane sensor domain MASE1
VLANGNTNAAHVWPPEVIALASVMQWGCRIDPIVFLVAFSANIMALKALGLATILQRAVSAATAAGNMLDAFAGACIINRFYSKNNPFDTMKDLYLFIIFGILACTAISAIIGALSFSYASGDWPSFNKLWDTWWLDEARILVVSPIIFMLVKRVPKRLSGGRLFEAAVIFFILIVSSIVIFSNKYSLEYAIIPLLFWIALRFGMFFSARQVLMVSVVCVLCQVNLTCVSVNQVQHQTILCLQSHIGTILIITIYISELSQERRELDKSRLASQKQLYDIMEFLPCAPSS